MHDGLVAYISKLPVSTFRLVFESADSSVKAIAISIKDRISEPPLKDTLGSSQITSARAIFSENMIANRLIDILIGIRQMGSHALFKKKNPNIGLLARWFLKRFG